MRIAVAQAPGVRLTQWRETLALIDDLIGRAADSDADLVVLPECVWPAYYLGSKQAYFAARRAGLPSTDDFLQHMAEQARTRNIAICAGYVEECGEQLFNTAGLLDSAGRSLGQYRKCLLWDFDHNWFEPGRTIAPVRTPWGPIGLMICADARLPEIPATLAAQGARLILQPTAWVNVGPPEHPWNPQPDFLIPSRAREFGIPFVSASKWGSEGDTTFIGSSLICAADGNVLTRCGMQETTVVTADVELTTPRRPEITTAERAVLLSSEQSCEPCANVPPLDILPLPRDSSAEQVANHIRALATAPEAALLFGYSSESLRCQTTHEGLGQQHIVLTGPRADLLQIRDIGIGTVGAGRIHQFAAPRRWALLGCHIVLVFGSDTSDNLLKTRACENRIFVLAVRPEQWCLVDPGGLITIRSSWPSGLTESAGMTLDLTAAADKHVAPGTDILTARRPRQYLL